MKKKMSVKCYAAIGNLLLFLLWTITIQYVDVQAIGPKGSKVGLASWNGLFHRMTGVNWFLYHITDWLSVIPIFFAVGFGILGFIQFIKRKSIRKVDADILLLGGFYLVVFAFYAIFEILVINDRPVLIEGKLEASYPSSTTMLVLCVLPTAVMQLEHRVKAEKVRTFFGYSLMIFTVFMFAGRLISGVHWLTDIIGGTFLSIGLVTLYSLLYDYVNAK